MPPSFLAHTDSVSVAPMKLCCSLFSAALKGRAMTDREAAPVTSRGKTTDIMIKSVIRGTMTAAITAVGPDEGGMAITSGAMM